MPKSAVVVVVDAERAARGLVESVIRSLGATPAVFSSPRAALRGARARDAEVLVVDASCAVSAAGDVARLRQAHPTAALVVSGAGSVAFERSAALGADGVLEKPFEDPGRVRLVLERALDLARLGRRNERLVRTLEEKKDRLDEAVERLLRLHRTSGRRAGDGDLESVLRLFVEAAARALGADRVSLQLLDTATGDLVLRAGVGIEPGLRGARKRSGEGIAGRVLREGAPVLVRDLGVEPEYRELARHGPAYLSGSFVSAPIRLPSPATKRNRVVGLVHASNKRSGIFEREDLEVLSTLAGNLAEAVASEKRRADLVGANDQLATAHAEVEQAREEACTRSLELEGELEAKRKELAAALLRLGDESRTERRLLENVRHELKNPISAILGLAEVLDGDAGAETTARGGIAASIRAEARRLDGLVDELLRMARPAPFAPDVLDVAEVVSQALALLPAAASARLVTRVERGLVGFLDPESFREAVLAVLDNALRFSPTASAVGVELAERESDGKRWAVLAVRDAGPGIPPSERERVLDPFVQLGQPGAGKPPGLGLGLALARRAVTRVGGRISLGTAPARGAVVELWLPLVSRVVALP